MGTVIEMVRKQKTAWEYNLSSPVSDKEVTLKYMPTDVSRTVNRKVFLITRDDVGKQTISLGRILKVDVGKFYVVDNDMYDYVVPEIPGTKKSDTHEAYNWIVSYKKPGEGSIKCLRYKDLTYTQLLARAPEHLEGSYIRYGITKDLD